MKGKAKLLLFLVILVIAILLFFLIIFRYKKVETGNNISNKTLQEIENYILSIKAYNAKIELTTNSNKNSNKYIIKQEFKSPRICYQEVIEPENIKGLAIKYDGTNMQIINSKLDLSDIYNDYEYISDNVLWLSDFIANYKSNSRKNIWRKWHYYNGSWKR